MNGATPGIVFICRTTEEFFIDEYVFAGKRTSVNWENATIEQGTVKVKSFLFSSDKPYIRFKSNEKNSKDFIVEQENLNDIIKLISEFASYLKNKREEKLAFEKKAEEERKQKEEELRKQEENEKRIREEAKKKAEEEFKRKEEEEERLKEEKSRKEKELLERKKSEKQARIQKEVENCKNNPEQPISVDANVKKVASCFLDNPYRILGVSCVASNEEANQALDNPDERTFIANKMSNLGFETMTTNYNWLRAFFSNVLCKPDTKYTNAQKAEYWKSQAYLAMDSQNAVHLRKAVFELLDIMTSSSNQAISAFGADLTM